MAQQWMNIQRIIEFTIERVNIWYNLWFKKNTTLDYLLHLLVNMLFIEYVNHHHHHI